MKTHFSTWFAAKMWTDVSSVIWRDWHLYLAQIENRRRFVLGILVSIALLVAAELAFDVHRYVERAHPLLIIWVWCWLPLGSAVTLATDALAGERERRTLESLLATRLPARAILLGKTASIVLQTWCTALAIVFGALATLNLITIWNGTVVVPPFSVILLGPAVSFLLTTIGTLLALLISIDAATVRQANFRILLITSVLPLLLVVPILVLAVLAVAIYAVLIQFADVSLPSQDILREPWFVATSVASAVAAVTVFITGLFLVTLLRFTRERLVHADSGKPPGTQDTRVDKPAGQRESAVGVDRGPLVDTERLRIPLHESAWLAIVRDAWLVAWKELIEAKNLIKEWRAWIVVMVVLLALMVAQLSLAAGWYWAQDADLSLAFWLAMAGAIPVFIAQRSADAIAGERERRTGEVLFTTRLSATGILLGKLAAVALVPWIIALSIPTIGLIVTNIAQSSRGPFLYPADVFVAGVGLTLGSSLLFASGGMLVSLGAPTVQQAARRISWILLPILIVPGLLLRGATWTSSTTDDGEFVASGVLGFVASGELTIYILLAMPVVVVLCAGFILTLIDRFQRGEVNFS